jgi:hypothetical protein
LASLLVKDTSAQAKCKELVGLDFDPFLYTQEPSGHYKVGAIRQLGKTYRADVFPAENDKESRKPDVIAEFEKREEHWVFVDFHYPSGSDLITVLRSRPPCSKK